jgi:pro-kumamolisin-like protein/Big-like domain-containing protein
VLATISAPAPAQAPDEPSSASADQPLIVLQNTRHPLAVESNAIGRVEANRPLRRILLVLAPSQNRETALQQFLADQQNRNSPNYHHWLSAADFATRFGSSDADLQSALAWLQASGFAIERVATSKRSIEFSGTSAQVETAFHTVMKYYRVNAKTHLANSTDLAIPAAIASITRGPVSLNDFRRKPPVHENRGVAGRDAQGKKTILNPNLTAAGTTTTYYVAPGDFAAIYNTNGLLNSGVDGSGVSIAVTAQSQIELTDVQDFRQIFGLKANDPNFLLTGPDPGIADQSDSEEALLDVEWAGAVAPGATINLVVAGSTDTTSGADLAAAYAIDNQISPIVTDTYGACEQALGSSGNAFYNALWQQAAAEGITVVVASGDNGAAGCDSSQSSSAAVNGLAVNGAASTPYNIAVGGTEFADGSQPSTYWNQTNSSNYSSAIGYIPEAAWNESCDPSQAASSTNCVLGTGNFSLLASGGGASTIYRKPSWQSGPGVPADNARDVPDVALAAAAGHDETVYCTSLGGTPCQLDAQQDVVGLTLVGGTSVSTPAMAGLLALIEQKNGALQGQINYVLYNLAQTSGNICNSSNQTNPVSANSCVFYDITAGSNQVPCAGASPGCSSTQSGTNGFTTGQLAGPGYDLVTGLGSINATNLAAAWKNLILVPSQTTLAASATSFVHGTAVTLNGTVSATSGTGSPTGSISLKTDSYGDTPQTLPLGTAGAYSGTVSAMPGGKYNLLAYYSGDATFASSESSSIAVNVTPENSNTTVNINGLQSGSAGYGAPLQLKVATAGISGQGVATGTVTLEDGTTLISTSALASDGTAYLLTGGGANYAFAPGSHSVTAQYAGDNSFNASTSSAVTFTVTKGTPFVVVGANTLTLAVGQTLGVHTVVAGQGTAPATGTIQFTVDGAAFSTPVTLQTGGFFGPLPQAAMLIPNLTQGTHVIGASYNGTADPNYSSVNTGDPVNELTQTVTVSAATGTKTTTSLTMKTAPVNMGDTGVFTVSVTPASATGTVTLWDAVGPRTASAAIAGGAATVQFPWTQAGSTSLYAVYSGDSADAGSASTPVSFTVQKDLPQVSLAVPVSIPATGEVSLVTTVVGNPSNSQLPYPTGIVEFWDSANGAAAQMLIAQTLTAGPGGSSVSGARLQLKPGSHSLYTHYRGDTNWQSANSSTMQIAPPSFSVSVSPNPLAFAADTTGNGTVTITPSNGFTGVVTLACATGGTFLPAGYSCSFGQTNVTVNNVPSTTTLSLSPSSSPNSSVKKAILSAPGDSFSRNSAALFPRTGKTMVFLAGLTLLVLFVCAPGAPKIPRNFLAASGLILCVTGIVLGCGGSGGGGGGPYSTTTTIASTNLDAPFGTPVTFTVTVKPSGSVTPTGMVQLYDNGQVYGSPTKVSAGIAIFQASSLPIGVHNLQGKYQGDAKTLASTSAAIAQIVTGQLPLQISGTNNANTETFNFTVVVN